jgi:hypothetical protein
MGIRRVKFPRSQGDLRTDWKDKSKPARVKITPSGSQKHHLIGDMAFSRTVISIEGTNSGFLFVEVDQFERAQHQNGETWIPFDTEEFNHASEFLEVQFLPHRSGVLQGISAASKKVKSRLDFRKNPGPTVDDRVAELEKLVKTLEAENDALERKLAAERGLVADAIATGMIPSDLDLPFPLKHVVRLHNVFDGFCLEYKSDRSTLHLIEGNYTSSSKAAFTWAQRKVIKQIKEGKLFVKFHSICWTQGGWVIKTL